MIGHQILLLFFIYVSSAQVSPTSKCGPVLIDPDYYLHRPLICRQATIEDLPLIPQPDYEELTFVNSTVPIVRKEIFNNFPNLINFNAINSSVEIIENDAFENRSMRWINLSFNKLKRINPNLFQDSPDIYRLDLSNNSELVIPERESFLNAPNLKWLVLSGCNIENLSDSTFKNLTGLQYLTLSKNNLKVLPICVFSMLKSLEKLDLSDNKLTTVSLSIFNHISPTSTKIFLEGNPWKCDCDLHPVIQWSKHSTELREVRCVTLSTRKWKNFKANCTDAKSQSSKLKLKSEIQACLEKKDA